MPFLHLPWQQWKRWLLHLFFPRQCCMCHQLLPAEGICLCGACYAQLPFTHCEGEAGNFIERIFWGKFNIARAFALYHYFPHTPAAAPVKHLKYYHRKDYGFFLGQCMAQALLATDFFASIDVIVPIPITKRRKAERGYNQSEWLAKGVADLTGLSIDTHSVVRTHFTTSQTSLSLTQRQQNVQGAFAVCDADALQGKHLLLVDDVLTTGATLTACAQAIEEACPVTISVLTLCIAGEHGDGAHYQALPDVQTYSYTLSS